mgnify:CR=1 FL=1
MSEKLPKGRLGKRSELKEKTKLAKMGVNPDIHGKGIGKKLGEHVINKARELGATKLYLESNRILVPAITLYKKLGFEEITGYQSPYERCDIQMELPLV